MLQHFSMKMLNQHFPGRVVSTFSKENDGFNIFQKCFINNFHEKCLSTFPPNVQRFSEKKTILPPPGPLASGGSAHRRATDGLGAHGGAQVGAQREHLRARARWAGGAPVIPAARG
jgi:hypothetical protein